MQVYFAPTEYEVPIFIDLIDDSCYEFEPERFIVQLSMPGGVVLSGKGYTATVRIDDDDAGQRKEFCYDMLRSVEETRWYDEQRDFYDGTQQRA